MALKTYIVDYRVTLDMHVVVRSPLPPDRFTEEEARKLIQDWDADGEAQVSSADAIIIGDIQPEEE